MEVFDTLATPHVPLEDIVSPRQRPCVSHVVGPPPEGGDRLNPRIIARGGGCRGRLCPVCGAHRSCVCLMWSGGRRLEEGGNASNPRLSRGGKPPSPGTPGLYFVLLQVVYMS